MKKPNPTTPTAAMQKLRFTDPHHFHTGPVRDRRHFHAAAVYGRWIYKCLTTDVVKFIPVSTLFHRNLFLTTPKPQFSSCNL